jgi:hypothetical protein
VFEAVDTDAEGSDTCLDCDDWADGVTCKVIAGVEDADSDVEAWFKLDVVGDTDVDGVVNDADWLD